MVAPLSRTHDTYTHMLTDITHTRARTHLPCLSSPPTYIRRNIAAVVAQMASIFVLPVVVARHVCTCVRACTCNRAAARSGDIEASRDVVRHRRKTLQIARKIRPSPSMSVTGSRDFSYAFSPPSLPPLPPRGRDISMRTEQKEDRHLKCLSKTFRGSEVSRNEGARKSECEGARKSESPPIENGPFVQACKLSCIRFYLINSN